MNRLAWAVPVFVSLLILLRMSSVSLYHQDRGARLAAARAQIASFFAALDTYHSDVGEFPTETQGLDALWIDPGVRGWNGPYLRFAPPADPRGVPYRYRLVRGLPLIVSIGGGSDVLENTTLHNQSGAISL